MNRVYNFNAGPAMLPTVLLEKAQQELLNWQGLGASVMEISHRSEPFRRLMTQAKQDLRELMQIPNNYHILFLASPARSQFANVPLNLLGEKTSADYLQTGFWSELAAKEAGKYCRVNLATNAQPSGYQTIAEESEWQLDPKAAYVYCTSNETVNGMRLNPSVLFTDIPLVADMTSYILSEPVEVSRFGLIFAGAQKNIGPSGLTLVIIRDDLLWRAKPMTLPSTQNYQLLAAQDSLLYTPPTFAIYMASLMFSWCQQQGGLAAMAKQNQAKAQALYAFIDNHDFYQNAVAPAYRSRMNVVFTLASETLIPLFVEQAEQAGLMGLKGHAAVGGLRASLYNAMPLAGVTALVDFMADFARRYG